MNYIFENIDEITYTDTQKESVFKKTVFAIFFIWMYQYIHLNYLSEVWSYMRYFKNELDFNQVILMYFFSLFPIYFYSGLKRISSYFSIIIFVMAYIPIIITINYNNTEELGFQTVLLNEAVLSLSMSIFFLIDRAKSIKSKEINFKIPFNWFHLIAGIITGYLLYKFSGNMRFVGFADVYELRFENSENSDSLSQYFTMWATYFVYPIYFTIGLVGKNKINLIIGIIGHIIIYMITGAKASILMPLIIFLFYSVLKKIKYFSLSQSLLFFIACFALLLFWVDIDALFVTRSVFLMRTLSMPGYLFSNYLSFFSTHPNTNYSHIGLVNSFTNSYPYGNDPIGVVIGNYDSTNANANANFWATDGVAAQGIIGIVIITVIMFLFLLWINSLFKNRQSIFYILVFTGEIFSLLNVSFFTTLLSSGLLFLVFILKFFDFDKELSRYKKNTYEKTVDTDLI